MRVKKELQELVDTINGVYLTNHHIDNDRRSRNQDNYNHKWFVYYTDKKLLYASAKTQN